MLSKMTSSSNLILGIIEDVDIYKIKKSPSSYRSSSPAISELAKSICQTGLLQPITVRSKDDFFEIVAGNRRYEACKALGWRRILCHIVELNDKEAFEVSLIENIQRRTLNPIEEARAFKSYVQEFGWGGISELASNVGKSISYVDKRIRLLDLPVDVLESICNSTLNLSIAEELMPIHNEREQSEFAKLISKRHLSYRKAREIIKDYKDCYDADDISSTYTSIGDLDREAQRSFDKAIITLRIAMNKLGSIIGTIENNWIIYEILMQHRNVLHSQIDILMKQKKKI
jgi:ParB family transcriptional regulator, chromosome partitioning protein